MSNKMTASEEDPAQECPLCMENLEVDDLFFYPCTCGYQICLFCWHRIRTDENGLCPACRKPYPENPAGFKALSIEEFQQIKNNKRQKEIQKKQKLSESRKHLQSLRVVQKNLVFVVGLPSRLAEPETLKKNEYFGKYGKIHKVAVNSSTTYAGSQGPSSSAYVTYLRPEDALRAIQHVNNLVVDGRTLKASLGTTKYCSFYLKHHQCLKTDCMYLHEIGDEAASFTKEEMQQGKHLEYEKRLHEQMLQNEKANMDQPPASDQPLINNLSTEGFPSHKTPTSSSSSSSTPPTATQKQPKGNGTTSTGTERKTNYKRKVKKEPRSTEPLERAKSREKPPRESSCKPVVTETERPPSTDPVEHRSQESSPSSGSPFLTPIGSLTDRPVTPPSLFPSSTPPHTNHQWSFGSTENHFLSSLLPPSQLEKEDELGFDPCEESTRALQEIMEKEAAMKQEIQRNGPYINSMVGSMDNSLLYSAPTENGPQRPLPNPPPGFTTAPMNGLIHSSSCKPWSPASPPPSTDRPPVFKDHYHQPVSSPRPHQFSTPVHLMSQARQQEELRKMLPNIKISFGPTVPQMLPRSKVCPTESVFRQQESHPVAPTTWLPPAGPRTHHPDSLLKLQQLHLEEPPKSWNQAFPQQQLPPPGFPYKYTTDNRNGVQNSIEGSQQPSYFYPFLEREALCKPVRAPDF